MKHVIITLTILLTATICFGQIATYDEVITKKKKGKITTYITKRGQEICEGDTITIGVPFNNDNYDYIYQFAGISTYPLTSMASGSKVRIKRMKAHMKMVYLYTTKPNGFVYGLYVGNVEGALENGELVDEDFITSEKALEMLKTEKDKLDLGLITQEEYDEKKIELSKFIK
jgi:hypothetical protein